MHCSDVRRALPLNSDGTAEEAQVREHVSSCAECQTLETAYAADAKALAAFASQREEPAIMVGFADDLMARLAEEPAREAPILKPDFASSGNTSWVAVAAVLLVAIALGMILGTSAPQTQPVVADGEAPVVEPAPAPQDVVAPDPVVADNSTDQPLAAPRRTGERAPTPRLRRANRGGIVPVGGEQRPSISKALRNLQRVFPNWSPNGLDRRVPPLRKGEREVRF